MIIKRYIPVYQSEDNPNIIWCILESDGILRHHLIAARRCKDLQGQVQTFHFGCDIVNDTVSFQGCHAETINKDKV